MKESKHLPVNIDIVLLAQHFDGISTEDVEQAEARQKERKAKAQARRKKYAINNPEAVIEAHRKYNKSEKCRAYMATYRKTHRQQIAEIQRRYRERHRQEISARRKAKAEERRKAKAEEIEKAGFESD